MESDHWYVPGKTDVEKQHLNEHETLQLLQRHALNKNEEEFVRLLNTFPIDKQGDLMDMMEYVKEDKQV